MMNIEKVRIANVKRNNGHVRAFCPEAPPPSAIAPTPLANGSAQCLASLLEMKTSPSMEPQADMAGRYATLAFTLLLMAGKGTSLDSAYYPLQKLFAQKYASNTNINIVRCCMGRHKGHCL